MVHNAQKRQTLIFKHDPQLVQPRRAANPRFPSRQPRAGSIPI